jgi:hypothetical protein
VTWSNIEVTVPTSVRSGTAGVATVLLDTHLVHRWSAEPQRISEPAREVLEEAEELAIAGTAVDLSSLFPSDRTSQLLLLP